MARLESTAVGGYFPTPNHLLTPIAELFDFQDSVKMLDPCAGDGAAIIQLSLLSGSSHSALYTCELEKSRHKALVQNVHSNSTYYYSDDHHLQGDAFRVDIKGRAISFLYLNPPYDLDPVHGRLEQRFLERFEQALVMNGVLCFVVPHYALKASAQTLAQHFDDLKCFRFPGDDFGVYKQVVLIARRVDSRLSPDPKILAQVTEWSASVEGCPALGDETEKMWVPSGEYIPHGFFQMRQIDMAALLGKARVWRQKTRTGATVAVPHVLPDVPVENLLFRTYPLATPPRPAHIASGIAAGIFNGHRVTPKRSKLPDLLVKGVFDREYVTVEEKQNKKGEVTSVVQVQQPKLVTTVLDLTTKRYTTLATGPKSGSTDIEKMTIEDLLDHYGDGLMGVMRQQCPVMYDPKRGDAKTITMAPISRNLYQAQDHASRALVKLLGGNCERRERLHKAAILLGEIGSGKTSVALAVGRTVSKRMLVMCPPHLLQTWMDETRTVIPEAEFRILENVSDVDAIQDIPADKMVIAVLSREVAKLGHGMDDVTGQCPKCGAALPEGQLAKRHATCTASTRRPKNALAHAGVALALKLINVLPKDSRVADMLPGRHLQKCVARFAEREEQATWKGFDPAWIDATLEAALERGVQSYDDANQRLIARLLLANYRPLKIAQTIDWFMSRVEENYLNREFARELAYLLPPKSEIQAEAMDKTHKAESWGAPNRSLDGIESGKSMRCGKVRWALGQLSLDDHEPGSVELAQSILIVLSTLGHFTSSEECGERLYQAAPRPRRYPLSRYITSRHPRLFDFLVLDEGHEYATDGSAQERSAHRLTSLGLPTILMTGSIMNGYAESLFSNMWALSEDFRAEFTREERQLFISRYGYRKRVLSDKDMKSGEVIAFGSHTDRVERSERVIGDAPGLLPIFLFRHLLRFSVTLHKADLALDLPPCRQIVERIQPETELMASYLTLFETLKRQIKADQYDEAKSGKLFGALAELPSYLDRSTLDTGNQKDGTYTIRYPESVGGDVVAVGQAHPAGRLSNKEQWVIQKVLAELAEGRNVMVFTWHVSLLPRLARIIKEAIGEEVAVLNSDKVPTGKRQDWIDKNVVQKNRRVMVLNPVTVSTGLNNLVHFSTEIWHENPAVNPNILRQAIGRVDRIGAKKETRIFFPIYDNTLQEALYDLLMKKVAVAISTDGLDQESMLNAAGVGTEYITGLSIGRQLWAMIS